MESATKQRRDNRAPREQEEKQFEEARKMARDILEVPAFIRKKQNFEVTNN